MSRPGVLPALLVLLPILAGCITVPPGTPTPVPRAVMLDSDIGDDIDDAYALALLLRSPALRLESVAGSFGDTALRARLLRRLLGAAGQSGIAVLAGPSTPPGTRFTQRAFAEAQPPVPELDAVSAMLDRLRTEPAGSITLVALAPLDTVGAMIRRDPVAFRRLRGVVLMGGWIERGYPSIDGTTPNPAPEYNVAADPDGLRVLLDSGVPTTVFPLDGTKVSVGPEDRRRIFAAGALGAALRELDREWHAGAPYPDNSVLYDVVPLAFLLDPSICSLVPLRLRVTATGLTVPTPGRPNASVCLSVDANAVRRILLGALAPEG